MKQIKPNLLIIGAQKCGTTWLHQSLATHPQVYMSKIKELEYFSRRRNANKPLSHEYLNHFRAASNAPVVGETTPSYLWSKDFFPQYLEDLPSSATKHNIPKTVRHALGSQVKLIAILRDPVERAISAYIHHVKMGRITPGSPLMEEGKKRGIIHMGFYFQHLTKWLQHFSREQLLICTLEEMKEKPVRLIRDVHEFLDIEFIKLKNARKVIHKGLDRRTEDGNVILRFNNKEFVAFTNEERNRLTEIYREDVSSLTKITNYASIQSWRNFSST